MKYQRFEDLPVWKAAIDLAAGVYALTRDRFFSQPGDLRDQLRRAALSVSNNIAEGFERGSTAELLAYLYIARGSAGEVRSMLHFLDRLPETDHLKSEISNLKSQIRTICSGNHMLKLITLSTIVWLLFDFGTPAVAVEPEIVNIWPDRAPGETKELPPEENVSKPEDKPIGGRPIIKLTNVSIPTLTIYRPSEERNTGAAIIVCPGGGHHILAFDHEGTEVAEWLTTIGVTGIVLKYRVPARNRDRRWEAAVQDAQRAIRVVRSRADEWEIDPQRIGILGFSAGGETAGLAALLSGQSQYEAIDDVDSVSARPDFGALIYAGGFVEQGQSTLKPHVAVSKDSPPMFFVHAFDDNVPADNSLLLAAELKKAGVPAELHLYASGGHGFGMRDNGDPCNAWPKRCEEWLQSQGWLKRSEAE